MQNFKALGFMDQTCKSKQEFTSWSEFTNSILTESNDVNFTTSKAMEWLGLFSTENINLPRFKSNLDGFSYLLQEKLAYKPAERDMALLHHQFIVLNPAIRASFRVHSDGAHCRCACCPSGMENS